MAPKEKIKKTPKAPSVITPEILEAEGQPKKKAVRQRKEVAVTASETDSDTGADNRSLLTESDSDTESEITGDFAANSENLPVPESHDEAPLPRTQQDLLKQYIREVGRYALLSPEEEFSLAVRLKETGDMEAARRLVSANLRLVVKIAMEYRSAYQNIMDLIQEGNIGLMKAVSKFDPSKGAKLSYYASWWIRSYILKYILDNFRLVRVGTTQAQKKLFFHLMREKERLEAQGLEAGPKLLADKLQVREQDVIEMEQRLSGRGAEMSLNNPIGGDEGEAKESHLDMLVDTQESASDVFEQAELKEILSKRIQEFAKTLKEKELAVFQERLAADQPKTLQEVADKFGLTRERARQIEAQVIEKLREYYKKYIR
jgi:RNA polymerase sigma-32 factor